MWLTVDIHKDLYIRDITAAHPDVRAVVGANTWVNFSGEQIDPLPAT